MQKRVRAQTKLLVTIAVLSAIYLPAMAHADDSVNIRKEKAHKIEQIKKEVKAKKIVKSVTMGSDNGGPVTDISEKIIKKNRGVSNAESILNNSPGVNVTTSNPIGTRVHTSIRGFKGSQVGYTFDNLPLSNILNGGMTGGDSNDKQALYNVVPLTLGETDGIRIQFGPTPTNVNSFGAMGGTVEYLPRMPTKKFYTKIFGGYGSYATKYYGAELNTGKSNELGNLFVRFSSRQTNNFFQDQPNRLYSYYAAYTLPSLSGRTVFTGIILMNKTNGLVPSHMPVPLTNKYGASYQYPITDVYAKAKGDNIEAILGLKDAVTNRIILDGKVYYQYQNYNELGYINPAYNAISPYIAEYYPFGPGAPFGHYDVVNKTIGIAPTATIFLGKNYHYRLKFGGLAVESLAHDYDYFLSSPSAPQIETVNDTWDEHQHRILGKLFAQGKFEPIQGLIFYPGVKYEYVDSLMNDIYGAYEQGDYSGNSYTNVTPYMGVTYKLTKHINTYANFGINYKYPNMSAYYAEDETSPPVLVDIHPEKVETYQFGAQYKSRKVIANIAFYRQNFTDVFSSYYDLMNGLSYQYNFGSAQYQGMNIGLDYDLSRHFNIFTNYSLQGAVYTTSSTALNGASVTAGDPKQYTPTYLYNVGLRDKLYGVDGSIWANFVGPQYVGTSGGAPTSISLPAYKTLNLSLSYTLPIRRYGLHSIKLALNATNLLNSNAYSFAKQFENSFGTGTYLQGNPLLGRFISSEISVKF